MSMVSYQRTKIACYLGYITQAISINLLPLLYVMMQEDFSVSLTQLGLLATIVFAVQMAVDLLAARFGRYLSFRVGCVAAHAFAAVGLVLMIFLPHILSRPYTGVVIAAVLLSVGGGLTEVLISPVIDAIPSEQKTGQMSLLHSFYCWGVVGVSLLSTLFFAVVGAAFWRWLLLLWAAVPLVTMVMFLLVPLPPKPEETVAASRRKMRWSGSFCLMLVLMICAGATELGLAQWASLFVERGLNVSKAVSDLLGPCAFALCQGVSRVSFARISYRSQPSRLLLWRAFGCIIAYAVVALSPWPLLSLLGFCVCGWCVGPMWPGILSMTSARFPAGGTTMFALLALCGDIGCAVAPAMVGVVSDRLYFQMPVMSALQSAFGLCMIFPIILLVGFMLLIKWQNCVDRT